MWTVYGCYERSVVTVKDKVNLKNEYKFVTDFWDYKYLGWVVVLC
jgi:hypothetical protein